jgi:hypothetical protein
MYASMMPRYKHIMCLTITIITLVYVTTSVLEVEYAETNNNVKVVAYYQTSGSNQLASNVVLYMFRSVYPSAPLYIHYDMDHPLSTLGVDLITFNDKNADKSNVSYGMYFSSVIAMETYIQRIKTAAGLQKNGWVLLLEDDVWVWTQIKQNDLKYDVTGTCKHPYSPEYSRIIKSHSPHHQVFRNASCYGAYGGHYINSSRILGLKDYHDLLTDLLLVTNGLVASDMLLSTIILVDGGTIGGNPGFYEFGSNTGPVFSNEDHGSVNILHEMKWLYFMKYLLY